MSNPGQETNFPEDTSRPQLDPQASTITNRDGSGHVIHAEQSIGSILLGFLALILLMALLRSEARYRALQTQLLNHKATD